VICPRCSHDNHDFAIECERCGVVFSKLDRTAPAPPPIQTQVRTAAVGTPTSPRLGSYEYKMLAFGVIAAAIAQIFWPTRAALGALKTLLHECGHAHVAWL
jgi:hypothetical protein